MSKTILKVSRTEFNLMKESPDAARPEGFTGSVWRFMSDGKWHVACASNRGVNFATLKVIKKA